MIVFVAKPRFPLSRTALRLLGAFVMGAVVGAASLIPLVGHRVDDLHKQTDQLLLELTEYKAQVENLRQSLETRTRFVIQEVRVEVVNLEDEARILSLKKQLRPYVQELVGRQITRVDPELTLGLLEGRSIMFDDKQMVVRVKTLIVAPTTQFFLEVNTRPVIPQDRE